MTGQIGFKISVDGKEFEPKQEEQKPMTILDLVREFLQDNYYPAHQAEQHELYTLAELYRNLQKSFPGEYTQNELVMLLRQMEYRYTNIEMEVHYLVGVLGA